MRWPDGLLPATSWRRVALGGYRRRALAVLAAAVVTQVMTAPGQTVGVSVFVDHLVADLPVSRSGLSAAYLVGTAVGALSLPTTDHRFPRSALGHHRLRRNLWRRPDQGTHVSGALFAALLITAVGWRATFVVLGGAVWLVLLPQARRVILDQRRASGEGSAASLSGGEGDWSRSSALRHTMFWILTAAVALSALVTTGLVFHQITLLASQGLTPAQAAANFVPHTLAAAVAAIGRGRLADRLPASLLLPGRCCCWLQHPSGSSSPRRARRLSPTASPWGRLAARSARSRERCFRSGECLLLCCRPPASPS